MKTTSSLRRSLLLLAASGSLLAVSSASAQTTLTWDITPGTVGSGNGTITGGTGTWNSSNGNWTSDAGANNVAWDNTSPSVNTALFNANGIAGTGTVTLGETINLKALTFSNLKNSGPVQKYTITGSTLAFATGGSITTGASLDNVNNAEYASINSAITGAPNVSLSWSGGNNVLVFAPTSGSQALGTVSGNGWIKLAGSTTGNSIVGASSASSDKIMVSSGTWTLTGTAIGYEHVIQGGTLIISTGSLQNNSRDTTLSGTATLHWNNAGAIRDVTISTARDRDFRIDGGSIDNTSGAAITTSTHNPQMRWNGNWTFIGSNGANSNLYMGSGDVFITGATRQVSVTNAATTLAVGGAIAGTGFGLTKAGAGTLELRGASTYTGATTVSAGTLAVKGSLANTATSVASASSARLQGSGLIVGPVTIGNNGTLAPGNSIESLGVGALTFDANSTFDFEFHTNLFDATPNVSADLVYSTGALSITPGALLTLTELGSSTALAPGSKLTLASYTGSAPAGVFTHGGSPLADGDTKTIGANTWRFNYADTSGGPNFAANQSGASNYFTMTVVPEAGTGGLLALGLLLIRRLWRRAARA